MNLILARRRRGFGSSVRAAGCAIVIQPDQGSARDAIAILLACRQKLRASELLPDRLWPR